MRILADYHHGDLFESLRILFEVRLGWELYRPIGLDWWREGYWKVWNHEATARQFLSIELTKEWEQVREIWLNAGNQNVAEGIYHIPDPNHSSTYKGVTLQHAKGMNFDIVLSSMPQHFEGFEKFRTLYCPRGKHVFQMGNMWMMPAGCKNVLNSTNADTGSLHAVRYHQEFSTTEFAPLPCVNPKSVTNLMHYQHEGHCYAEFASLRSMMPDWKWLDHGAGNEHGPVLAGQSPRVINDAGFIFHCKRGGEGYGYNIHYAFACGRPMVVRRSLYDGMVADPLFTDGQTCIDLDVHTPHETVNLLRAAAEDWPAWSERVQARFKQVVDFDAEFVRVKSFLERLV